MRRATSLVLVLASIGAAGCVRRVETRTVVVEGEELRREDTVRAAVNLPDSFTVITRAATPRDCPPALRDDGLGTTLTLRRSLLIPVQDTSGTGYHAFGDYAVEPVGRYGEEPGEGLRVDCVRLRAAGIITLR